MDLPQRVTVRDVGPRDGLQNVDGSFPTNDKIALVDALSVAGVPRIEATSFVSPRAVPQMADAAAVMAGITRRPGTAYEALVPNERGAHDAIAAGADALVAIVATSETFGNRNVGMSIWETLDELERIAVIAASAGVRCVISVTTAFGCAYEGEVPPSRVFDVLDRATALGLDEVTLCDTVGRAHPAQVAELVAASIDHCGGALELGLHFHNTRGLGLANVLAGLQAGVTLFDASLGGLGGCPFAPNATGNVCSEDTVHLLNGLGIATGIDLGRLLDAARDLEARLGATLPGQVMKAGAIWDEAL